MNISVSTNELSLLSIPSADQEVKIGEEYDGVVKKRGLCTSNSVENSCNRGMIVERQENQFDTMIVKSSGKSRIKDIKRLFAFVSKAQTVGSAINQLIIVALLCCCTEAQAQTPPTITSQPNGQVVSPGTNVTFNVGVSGTGPFTYRWMLNGFNMPAIVTTVAGNGRTGFSGDGGPATNASLYQPYGLALDNLGNLYIADNGYNRVRKVDTNGIITTVAGNGGEDYSGDGVAATNTTLSSPKGVTVDASGSIFIADAANERVRKVDAQGIIHTLVGNTVNGYFGNFSGDGGPAVNATVNYPWGVTLDSQGNLFIADEGNNRIRKINSSGIITTVAGNGTNGFSGDGGPATNAALNYPFNTALDGVGNLYIADQGNNRIRKVDTNGIITTVAGGGSGGDGGAATNADLNNPLASVSSPLGISLDASGNLYICDGNKGSVRRVDTNGIITTIAGNGNDIFSGDGGPALNAGFDVPYDLALDAVGNVYVADTGDNRIREVHFAGLPTISITNANTNNAGDYMVVVSNPYGSVTSTVATLTLAVPPWFTLQPSNQTTLVGSNAMLAASAAGTSPINYSWYFNGTNLVQTGTNSSLSLNGVGVAAGGQYLVVASDVYGSTTSKVATLTVNLFAPGPGGSPSNFNGTVAWGDYNNDGFADLLLGNQIYKNLGGAGFTNSGISLGSGTVGVWGDYDNDGNLDILEASSTSGTVYRNLGNGTFTNLNLGLSSTSGPCVAWGDYDNDGRVDVLICGNLYRNAGNGTFVKITSGLPVVQSGSVAWGDFDRDGRSDVLIAGSSGGTGICRIYHNNGNGTFTDINAGLPGVTSAAAAWVDYDGDGFLDVLVAGSSNGVPIAQLYRNLGNGTFTNINAGFAGVRSPVVAWGDYDNDGFPDLFLSGIPASGNFLTQVYHNNHDGTFTPVSIGLTNVARATGAAWGDFNDDGRLDIFVSGVTTTSSSISLLSQGFTPVTNTLPTPPIPLSPMVSSNGVTFGWTSGTDTETPSSSLNYNLQIGTMTGGMDIVSPSAGSNGLRRLPQPGNAGENQGWTLANPNLGSYYWKVQTVDSTLAGSAFSAEQTFVFEAETLAPTGVSSSQAQLNGLVLGSVLPASAFFEWGLGTNRGNRTPVQNISSNMGQTNVPVSAEISGLFPGVVFGYHLILTNAGSAISGGEQAFITPNAPQITPEAASNMTATSVTLSALVNPGGAPTTVYFEYGLTSTYGSASASTNIGSGYLSVPVVQAITGLIGGQTYHFHVVATNSAGFAKTGDITFTTTPEPEVITLTATNIGVTTTVVNGMVRPNTLPTMAFFQYGLTTNYGATGDAIDVGSGTNLVPISLLISNLTKETTYHFRAVGSNSYATTYGADLSFTTTNDVIVLPAAAIGVSNATLNGLVNPNGLSTTASFQYGLTTNWGASTPYVILNGGTNLVPVSSSITGLFPGTLYYYQIVATNGAGLRVSDIATFQTLPLFSVVTTNIGGFISGEMAWGDYNNDGLPDMIVSDSSSTRIYQNLSNGVFTNVATSIPGFTSGVLALGDYNQDGWLDILLTGNSAQGPLTRLYRNNGNGTFTDINAGFPNVAFRSAIWGDFDNDGKPDILLVGDTNSVGISAIYHNNGDGTFSNMNANLPAFLDASASCADYDNDGRLDILLSGRVGIQYSNVFTTLLHNDGNGTFHDAGVSIAGVRLGFSDWADYDGDGHLDFILSGFGTGLSNILRLYRNNGDGTFSDATGSLPQYAPDAVIWGDYDNDGLPDLLVRGQQYISSQVPPTSYSAVLHNNGDGTFTASQFPLPEIWSSSGGWIDYEGDGRLDAVISGNSRTGPLLLFYHNNCPAANTLPSIPSGLSSLVSTNGVTLTWSGSSNAIATGNSLSYNLRVGSTPLGVNRVTPVAASNGTRQIVSLGNAGSATNAILNIPAGTYYWSVQAVDAAFFGTPFSATGSFVIPGPPIVKTLNPSNVTSTAAVLTGSVFPNGSDTVAQFEWGNTTALGNTATLQTIPASEGTNLEMQQLTGLLPGTNYYYRVVASNSIGGSVGSIAEFQTARRPSILDATVQTGGAVRIRFLGTSGLPYRVEASTNLYTWIDLGLATDSGSNSFQFLDLNATNYSVRFYRVSLQ